MPKATFKTESEPRHYILGEHIKETKHISWGRGSVLGRFRGGESHGGWLGSGGGWVKYLFLLGTPPTTNTSSTCHDMTKQLTHGLDMHGHLDTITKDRKIKRIWIKWKVAHAVNLPENTRHQHSQQLTTYSWGRTIMVRFWSQKWMEEKKRWWRWRWGNPKPSEVGAEWTRP